jgi:Tfp pilus assembly protein PilZ
MTDERRSEQRQEQDEQVSVKVALVGEEPISFSCSVADLSSRGIRIHGEQLLKINAHVDLAIRFEGKPQEFRLTGVVKWTTETTEKEHLAGIQLSDNVHTDIGDWKAMF